MHYYLVLVVVLATISDAAAKRKLSVSFCPSIKCTGKYESEIDRWDCIGRQLLGPLPKSKKARNQYFVEHDCGGVGWGNSIRGFFNAASLAAITGRRLIVTHKPFNRMFEPPYQKEGEDVHPHQNNRETWSYENHGRNSDNYIEWARRIKEEPETLTGLSKPVMQAGICGGDRGLMVDGDCFKHSMPLFHTCAMQKDENYLPDNALSVPFFYMLFKRPSARMVELLAKVRTRLNLPAAVDEKFPGQKGLQTPGYYILAFHIRHVPVGFEPLAIDLNKNRALEYRQNLLKFYWPHAQNSAAKAAEIAKCRGEKLLIYFATDDTENIRPVAEAKLSQYGRVAFGLEDSEVGHMSPQWTPDDLRTLKRVEKYGTLEGEKSYAVKEEHEEYVTYLSLSVLCLSICSHACCLHPTVPTFFFSFLLSHSLTHSLTH
eukprot:GSChrysophyteH1.ASY1.ANO1.2695.1 assembled CDS